MCLEPVHPFKIYNERDQTFCILYSYSVPVRGTRIVEINQYTSIFSKLKNNNAAILTSVEYFVFTSVSSIYSN